MVVSFYWPLFVFTDWVRKNRIAQEKANIGQPSDLLCATLKMGPEFSELSSFPDSLLFSINFCFFTILMSEITAIK